MDWTVYWFMLPVCIMVASIAMFSGTAMLTPIFLIGFPLLGVPRLSTVAAIDTSLFLETSGFGTGLYRYLRMRLADLKTAKALILVTLPLGALGAIAARHVPAEALRLGYGVAMLGLAGLLLRDTPGTNRLQPSSPSPTCRTRRVGPARSGKSRRPAESASRSRWPRPPRP